MGRFPSVAHGREEKGVHVYNLGKTPQPRKARVDDVDYTTTRAHGAHVANSDLKGKTLCQVEMVDGLDGGIKLHHGE